MKKLQNLNDLFLKLSSLKVFIVGDVMLDTYIYGNVDRISPEAPVPVLLVKNKESRCGGAANVAMNIRSLGATPYLMSVIGNDDTGQELKKILEQNHIESKYLLTDQNRTTTSKTRVVAKMNQILRFDSENNHALDEELNEALIKQILDCIEKIKPDVLIFQDYNKGVLGEKLIREVTMACLNKNIPVAVDPKKENFFAYQLCTLFKPNLRELEESLRFPIDSASIESLSEAAALLHKKLHHGISLITLSEKGIFLKADKQIISTPAHIRNVADVSGAGDTVISVAALCLAAKTSLETIAELSNIAGGIVCEYPGVVSLEQHLLKAEAEKLMN